MIALIGAVSLVIGAVIGYFGTRQSSEAEQEFLREKLIYERLDMLENNNRALWSYTQQLISTLSKHEPPPQPPAAIAHMYLGGK